MPPTRDWSSFLSDSSSKTELITFLAKYCTSAKLRKMFPLTITAENKAWLLSPDSVREIPLCYHHEADTRIIYHGIESNQSCVVVASDTDILILLLFVVDQHKNTGEKYL